MSDAGTQRHILFSLKKLLLWASLLGVELVSVGLWAGLYVAVVLAVSVASIAVMRRIVGLWAAYLTALSIAAVGFLCAMSTVGGPPEDLYQVLEGLLLCLSFGAIFGGPVALGVTCLLQFIVDLLAALLQSAIPASNNVVVGSPQ